MRIAGAFGVKGLTGKGHEGLSGGSDYLYLDLSDGDLGVYTSKCLKVYTRDLCILVHVNYISV